MGLAAVGHYPVVGRLTAGQIFMASDRVGKAWRSLLPKPRKRNPAPVPSPFPIVQDSAAESRRSA